MSDSPECAKEMADLSISRRGNHYYYRGHRYERAADAIAYARIVGARPHSVDDETSLAPCDDDPPPSVADQELMRTLAIVFERGAYWYGGFQYDHLIDAVNYARHVRQ